MKYSVGDIVHLKNTGEEARITEIINHEMAEVEINGTLFPVFMDEIEHPYLNWFLDKNKKNKHKDILSLDDLPLADTSRDFKIPKGFHFSFMPEFRLDIFDEMVEKLRVYFINESQYSVTLHYECLGKQGLVFSHNATIPPFQHFYLHDVPFETMHDQPRFIWRLQQQEDKQRVESFSDVLRIKPKKLFEHIMHLQTQNQPMFSIPIADDFPARVKEIPMSIMRSSFIVEDNAKTIQENSPIYEIDLHIENLVGNHRGMTNYDILKTQLSAFEKALDKAIRLRQHSLIVIHGVGRGRLKEEIHSIARSNNCVHHYHHDWSPRYGMGATEIFLK